MSTDDDLKRALRQIGATFEPNELAYLALTSKIERPIQNRLAYHMHKELFPKYVVVREWKKVDIAVFRKGVDEPKALIELKAMVNFNGVPRTAKRFAGYMLEDERKARKRCKSADVYSILLTAHPKSPILDEYEGKLKYLKGIAKAYKKHRTHEAVIEKTLLCLDRAFGKRDVIERGQYFPGGQAFGVDVDIHYCIVKAPPA